MVLSAPVAKAISREIFLLIDNQTPFNSWPSFNESPIDFCLTMSAPGILAQWQAARQVIVVPMGDVQFVTFQQMPAIGTRDLGSCSVVVLASAYGAILAHIPPQPARPSADPMAGDNNVRSIMDRVATLYERYKTHFPSADTAVICAWFQGTVALPDQMNIMVRRLQRMGLQPVIKTYHVPGNRNLPGQGTVIVIGGVNQRRSQIYVEDRLI